MADQQDSLRIHLSLVSHTNIGKTTLARTLLMRDVGEIADRAHVTEAHPLGYAGLWQFRRSG